MNTCRHQHTVMIRSAEIIGALLSYRMEPPLKLMRSDAITSGIGNADHDHWPSWYFEGKFSIFDSCLPTPELAQIYRIPRSIWTSFTTLLPNENLPAFRSLRM